MCPRKDPSQPQSRDEALGRLWDALQESGTLGSPEIESEDIDTITTLHGAEDVPPPDDELIQRMWGAIQPEVIATVSVRTDVVAANGHLATAELFEQRRDVDARLVSGHAETQEARSRSNQSAGSVARIAAIAAFSGFITGFVTLGAGSRIAMRIAAILSSDELQGAITTNQERVGEITLAGTWTLMLTGGFFGLGLGLGYALIRAYLPESGWRRIAASGAVFFSICGFATLEGGGNRDYERFGIAGLNICLFTLLPLLFGLMIVPVFDRLERRVDSRLPRVSRSPRTLLSSAALLFGLIMAIPGVMVLLVMPPLQLFIATPVLVWLSGLLGKRIATLFSPSVSTWLSRAALAAPCIAGLVLTGIAVGRIM
jgi:hypothetical protein